MRDLSFRRSQGRLWLFPGGGKEPAWKFDGRERSPVLHIDKQDIIQHDVAAVVPLVGKKDIFSIRAEMCIAVAAFSFDRVQLYYLPRIAIVQVQVSKTVVAYRIVQQEEGPAVPVETPEAPGAFPVEINVSAVTRQY